MTAGCLAGPFGWRSVSRCCGCGSGDLPPDLPRPRSNPHHPSRYRDSRMRILITGGAGFIGSHLADRLTVDGAVVRVLDNLSSGRPENLPKTAELLVGDVADAEAVQRASHRVEAIFHLAAITSTARALAERTRTRQVNATGTAQGRDFECLHRASGIDRSTGKKNNRAHRP